MAYCIFCGGHNPTCPTCGMASTITHNRNNEIEIAPIMNSFDNGATFKGAGNSHFTIDNGIFHETTELPGLGQKTKISIRTDFLNR